MGEKSPLKGPSLDRLQEDLNGVKYIIIDEYSVIEQKLFAWISRHCKQATSKATVPFEGISIILVGDVAQLPLIGDKVLYHNKPCGDLETEGFYVYHKFERVVKLSVNQRASGDDDSVNLFIELQINLRNGESTMQD